MARHAHLLVFAPGEKRIAGMALLYFEPILALHPDKLSLVVRAINPMPELLASHSASSIVDAFFEVARRIALDNGCASVVFPTDEGMHLLSNHKSIEDDIKLRYMRPAVPFTTWRMSEHFTEEVTPWLRAPRKVSADFDAYESGQTRVKSLYAIWHYWLKNQSGSA